jgi:hypothetical protein
MKTKFAMVMLVCGWTAIGIAQDKPQEKAPEAQCLIVAPQTRIQV